MCVIGFFSLNSIFSLVGVVCVVWVMLCMICRCRLDVGKVCSSGLVVNCVWVWFLSVCKLFLLMIFWRRNCDSGMVLWICFLKVGVFILCM